MRRFLSLVLAFASPAALGSTVLACSSTTDDPTSREDDVRVRTDGGSELPPGALKVVVPEGVGNVEATTVSNSVYRDNPVNLGDELGPLSRGEQDFSMKTRGQWFDFGYDFRATIEWNQTTTITAALVGVKAVDKGQRTLGLDALEGIVPSSYGIIRITRRDGNNNGRVDPASDGSRVIPLLADEYEINYGLGGSDGVPVRVEAGETKVVDLFDTTSRRVTRLKAPVRELPDADCGVGINNGYKGWYINVGTKDNPNWVKSNAFILEAGQTIDIGISPRHEGRQYMWLTGNMSEAMAVPVPDRGAGPSLFEIGRIDVDDVAISGRLERGRYQIMRANAQGTATSKNLLKCEPNTGTGVDMPPGRYRVEVTYSVREGDKSVGKVAVHVVDVP